MGWGRNRGGAGEWGTGLDKGANIMEAGAGAFCRQANVNGGDNMKIVLGDVWRMWWL